MPYVRARSYRRGGVAFLIGTQRNRTKAFTKQDPTPKHEPPSADAGPKVATVTMDTQEFDEYGAELEPDARVWKTYVKTANNFDLERFDEWNRSLDMTFIFAAFFAATCTAFLIESSKSLKEDPAERSARRLDQIATILAAGNITNPSPLNSTETISSEPFSPRPMDICINVLWTFSLITSAAVPPIAMLAKDWCYSLMSGRIGDPWSQTKRRQLRWRGIDRWKMEQFITLLPSFIHLAFLSFAIGLSIYLWDLNVRVAIPAIAVTLGSLFVYLTSTLLPLSDALCPYGTSVSRFVQRFRKRVTKVEHDSDPGENNRIAIEALAWLIKTSVDPLSTDIALQAIAGADPNDMPREPLKHSGADIMISRRLIGLDSYSKHYGQLSDLYTRAQAFFQSSYPTSIQTIGAHASSGKAAINSHQEPQKDQSVVFQGGLNRELQKKIRELRNMINREITAYVTSADHVFISTPDNVQALRIGSTAASHCIRALQHGIQHQTQELFDSAIDLLNNYRNRAIYLSNQEIQYMMIGTTMLLSSLLIDCPADIGAYYVMRLLRVADRAKNGQRQLRLEYLSLPLIVYALSQCNYPGWTQPLSLSPTSCTERAIEVITHYACHRDELSQASPFMINLALLELISKPEEYKLDEADILIIREAFAPVANGRTHIHTFLERSLHDSFSDAVKSMENVISNQRSGPLSKDTVAIACLTVLNHTEMDQSAADAPLGDVYAFVIEYVLTLPLAGLEADGLNTALDLMAKFHDPEYPERIRNLEPNLAQSLDKRGIFAQLRRATELEVTKDDAMSAITFFATSQAWFLIDLAIKLKATDSEEWRRCLSSFMGDDSLWNPSDHAIRTLEECRSTLAEQYTAMWAKYAARRHKYFNILHNSLSSTGPSAYSIFKRELQKKLRELRDMINREITTYVTSDDVFLSTSDNIQALRIGSTAASHCIRTLQRGIQHQTHELFNSAVELLDSYRNSSTHLNDREIQYLMIGTAMLLSCLLVECPTGISAHYIMRLLRVAERAEKGQKQLRLEYLGLPLVVYALLRHDYPGWTQPDPARSMSRAERAIEVITYYVWRPAERIQASSFMINIALLELIFTPEEHRLDGNDIAIISRSLDSVNHVASQDHIHTLPASPQAYIYVYSRTLSIITEISDERYALLETDAVITSVYLKMLNSLPSGQPEPAIPAGRVYAFIIECVLNPPSLSPEMYAQSAALDLMQKFYGHLQAGWAQDHILDLARSLGRRKVLTKLKGAAETEVGDTNTVVRLFATGQAWLLIDLAIKSETVGHEAWMECLNPFLEDCGGWEDLDVVAHRLEKQRSILAEQYRTMWENDPMRHHRYLRILYDLLRSPN